MNFTSNILGEIARAMKLSSPAQGQETTLAIPPSILLGIEPRVNVETAFGTSSGTSTAVLNSSWSGAIYGQTLNNGPLSFLGSFCAPGLWRFDWMAHFTSDFQNLAAVTSFGISNSTGSKFMCFCTFGGGINGVNQVAVSGSTLLEFSENYQPNLIVAPSGAAQHTQAAVNWIANRIL